MDEIVVELWKKVLEPFISFFGSSKDFLLWAVCTLLALLVTWWFFRKPFAAWVQNDRYNEHDTRLFASVEETMPEATLRDFVTSLTTSAMYAGDRTTAASLLEHRAQTVEATFLNPAINKLFQRYVKALGDLTLFTAVNFVPVGKGGEHYRMKPEVREKANAGIKESEEYWNKLHEELNRHCEKTFEAYKNYRKTVKGKLRI